MPFPAQPVSCSGIALDQDDDLPLLQVTATVVSASPV